MLLEICVIIVIFTPFLWWMEKIEKTWNVYGDDIIKKIKFSWKKFIYFITNEKQIEQIKIDCDAYIKKRFIDPYPLCSQYAKECSYIIGGLYVGTNLQGILNISTSNFYSTTIDLDSLLLTENTIIRFEGNDYKIVADKFKRFIKQYIKRI